MQTIVCRLSLIALLFAAAVRGADDKPVDYAAQAKALLEALVKEDYAAAGKDFDDAMKKSLPQDKLQETWKTLLKQAGGFKKQLAAKTAKKDKYDVVILTCAFEKLPLDVKVVFDGKQVTGLFFAPNFAALGEYKAPAYVRPDSFREVEVTVNPGEWELPGTLTLPRGDGPFPAVVLVQGSGPQDRDETVGPNKPFRDLAGGLASRGVAVLRYEKRTKQYAEKMAKAEAPLTINDEIVDDAVAAAALLRKRKEIDGKRVFVLGHSLGANQAPAVGARDPELAGLILLAGNTRPLYDMVVDQVDYLVSLKSASAEQLDEVKKQAEQLRDPKLAEKPKTDKILGAPVGYWLSLHDYDPAATAAKLKIPMLILQGERDYQVTMKDYEGWRKALKGRADVRFKTYPKLNHLFMEGEGKSQPDEYLRAGHVAAYVIDDIAEWVKK